MRQDDQLALKLIVEVESVITGLFSRTTFAPPTGTMSQWIYLSILSHGRPGNR